jgi:cell division protein FtsQ
VKAGEHYSFPVVTGILANDPQSTRAARMKIFGRFTSELDGAGEKISEELSEVDLSNPEDVQALIPDHSTEILVHFGEDNFLDRYRRFKEHLAEWRTLYPKLSSVDMRYERQVVLQMPPGAPATATSGVTPGARAVEADAPPPTDDVARPALKASAISNVPAKKKITKAKKPVAAVKHHPIVVRHPANATPYHPTQAVHP